MNLTADRLDVQKGERIRVTLFGASWTIGASAHTANELEDVGFHVRSLVDTLPAGPDWLPGKMDPPGFPNTILWAELEAKQTASLQTQLTEDLYVARAWPAPATSPAASSHPLHPYDVEPWPPLVSLEALRVYAFRIAYVLGREAAASWQ